MTNIHNYNYVYIITTLILLFGQIRTQNELNELPPCTYDDFSYTLSECKDNVRKSIYNLNNVS